MVSYNDPPALFNPAAPLDRRLDHGADNQLGRQSHWGFHEHLCAVRPLKVRVRFLCCFVLRDGTPRHDSRGGVVSGPVPSAGTVRSRILRRACVGERDR